MSRHVLTNDKSERQQRIVEIWWEPPRTHPKKLISVTEDRLCI